MKSTSIIFCTLLVFACFAFISCTPQPSAPESPTALTTRNIPVSTNTYIPLTTAAPTTAPTETLTSVPTSTSTATVTPVYIGTLIPGNNDVIGFTNLERLSKVAEWGRGHIQGVAFTPDGESFVVGSSMGLTIYNLGNINTVPRWLAFDAPVGYDQMYFNSDGQYLLLTGSTNDQIRSFSNGQPAQAKDITWIKPQESRKHSNLSVKSLDNAKEFHSEFLYEYNEKLFTEEAVIREMHNSKGELLYKMNDDIPYITYHDRVEPESCDLGVFSPCGNALMSLAMAPSKVEFSSSGETFTVLYNVPSLWNSKYFSFLRVYNVSDGKFIMSAGGREQPVSDFAYSPNSKTIGIAYLDGSIQLWDIGSDKARFGARHMNANISAIAYAPDGKNLLIQRGEELEIRRTNDGSMVGRFNAATFSVSPVENLVAIGDRDGMIRVRRIDNGENVVVFQAHTDLVYSVAFSADGRYIASGGRDCDIKLWDAKTGKLLHYFEETKIDAYDLGEKSRIFAYYMEFIPGTNTVVGFGSWGTAVAWDINSGATRFVIQSPALEYYNGMSTIKPHFPEFFTVDPARNSFYINDNGYDIETGKETGSFSSVANVPEGCAPVGPTTSDQQITFTRGYDKHEGQICVLNASSMELIRTITVAPFEKGNYFVGWLYLSPNSKQLIVTMESGMVYVYQITPTR